VIFSPLATKYKPIFMVGLYFDIIGHQIYAALRPFLLYYPYKKTNPTYSQQTTYPPTATHPGSRIQRKAFSKWQYMFIVLGLLQAISVALYVTLLLLSRIDPGIGYAVIFLSITVLPVIAVAAVINIIALPFYLAKSQPTGKERTMSIISMLLSLLLLGYGGYIVVHFFYRS